MRYTILAAACLAAVSTAAPAFDFSTGTTETLPSPGLMTDAGDVNGDQLDDVVIATGHGTGSDPASDYSLFVYLQQPSGALAAPLKYVYGRTDLNMDMMLADLNKDGALDVVDCNDTGLVLLVASGSGFTKTSQTMGTGWSCRAIGVLDVNGDGNPDVVTQSASATGGMTIVFGNGKGGFTGMASLATPAKTYMDLKVGDVTGDGRPDVVLLSGTDIDVYPGSANGLGSVQTYVASTAGAAREVAIGDFNHDGRNDVAVSIMSSGSSNLWLFAQTSTGTLSSSGGYLAVAKDAPAGLVAADLDRNGRTDLLVGHLQDTLGYYMQGNTGLAAEVLSTKAATYFADHRSLAVADVNDDGCPDAVSVSSLAGRTTLFGSECRRWKATADFDLDGKSDLVWRNTQTGANVIWRAADSARSQTMSTVASQAWQVAGVGDFDGDVVADLLWHNVQTGANSIWLSGNSTTSRAMTQVTNLDWQIVGVGDFDGDGIDDVLWRNRATGANAIWKAANAATQLTVGTLVDAHWKVVGVADFDHDYRADILWRNDATGADMLWPAANAAASRALTAVTSLSWTVAGVGDFDGDGKADVFWHNTVSGANTIWRGASPVAPMAVAAVTGNWSVLIGDYNGDGKADMLWRNATTGVDVMWRAGQTTVQLPVTDVTSTAWKTVR